MSTVYSIKNGLDIKLLGEAEKTLVDLHAKKFAIKPLTKKNDQTYIFRDYCRFACL